MDRTKHVSLSKASSFLTTINVKGTMLTSSNVRNWNITKRIVIHV
jgi:hypothetical protein